jgi:scyllo-inositol 2-dehydrogenase (NAD+)
MSDIAKKELKDLNVSNISNDIDQVINDHNVDAIFIASPTFTHDEIIRKIIMTKKKYIFCEKPLNKD